MLFKDVIRNARLALPGDNSVEACAADAGVSASYWYKLEAGEKDNPSLAVARRLAATLSLSVEKLSLTPMEKAA